MDDPDVWRWVWLVATFVFGVGEIAVAGSFFLLNFAVGAAVACVLAFAGVGAGGQWLAFVVVSAVCFAALYPLRKRLDRTGPADGIGSRRLIGAEGPLVEAVPSGPGEVGMVRLGSERWRAESADRTGLAEGLLVRVVEVRGTRVVVTPSGH